VQPLVQGGRAVVVHVHAERHPPVAEPPQQVLGDPHDLRTDALAAQRRQHFEMAQQRYAGKVPPNVRLLGGLQPQVHVADQPPVDERDEQHAPPGVLAGQPVGEEAPLAEDGHQRREVGPARDPDVNR
jgi:hypothetical protein